MSCSVFNSTAFLENHRKKTTDFTRNRTLTFPRLISFMLNAFKGQFRLNLFAFSMLSMIATYQQRQ